MGSTTKQLILITGVSSFLASYCILQAFNDDYRVRTTIRSLRGAQEVRDTLSRGGGARNLDNLTFVEADLAEDEGWAEAVKDCTYVLHVASPLPAPAPKNDDELIIPARDGALRVRRAARDAGVKRVVLTSGLNAVTYDHAPQNYANNKTFTDSDWTNVDASEVGAYVKSNGLELATVNPGLNLGPILSAKAGASVQVIQRLLNGSLPLAPRLSFPIVDVRDAASLHLLAMTSPEANGQRFIGSNPAMTMKNIAAVLRDRLGRKARRAPTREFPDIVLKLVARFDPAVALVVPELGKTRNGSNEKARDVLEWEPRPVVETVVDTAESFFRLDVLKV